MLRHYSLEPVFLHLSLSLSISLRLIVFTYTWQEGQTMQGNVREVDIPAAPRREEIGCRVYRVFAVWASGC